MMSVAAAALIAGAGFANAQGTGTSREAPSAGSTAQQSAPSSAPSSATPMNRDSSDKGGPAAKTTQSDEKALPGGAKSQRAQDNMKAGPKSEKSAQDNIKGEKSKSMSSENDNAKGTKDMKAEGREGRSGDMKAQGREDRMNAEQKGGREDRLNAEQKGAVGTQSQTTGQAGAGAKLSTEQRTRITSVIRDQHVAPITDASFAVSIGTRIPRDVTFHPLPVEIVSIYPEWRGYEFILVRNQIVVVDPRTLEIVAVLEA
jgi:hypothetical protein